MKITIKHLEPADKNNPDAFDVKNDGSDGTEAQVARLLAAGAFRTVAILETADVDTAFGRTQSVSAPWIETEAATITAATKAAGGCRSTSVGDILETPAGSFMVDPIGFHKIAV
jgi:hypothetical protein